MGDPLTAASAAGLGVSLLGKGLQAQGEVGQLEAKRQAELRNQQLAEGQAADVLQRGAQQAGQLRMKGSEVVAEQHAGFAASGIDASVGTPAEVAAGTKAMTELDAQTAMNNAARQAWGFKVSANQYGAQADLDQRAKGEVVSGSILGGIGQAIAGGTSIYKTSQGMY